MNECKKEKRGGVNFFNCDNIEFMKTKSDNYYDLAIVDPPYGISIENSGTHFKKYEAEGWDSKIPPKEYFEQLFRVSKNQIIWGGNYFLDYLGNTKCMIIWDKKIAEKMSFAMCEIAWTSLNKGAKIYNKIAAQKDRLHPTQKPIDLYRWTLLNFAEKGMKILDTHGGSHTHAIACDMEGFELDICEINAKYFNKGVAAYDYHKRQAVLF